MQKPGRSKNAANKFNSYSRLVFRNMHTNKSQDWRKGQAIKVWSRSASKWCPGEIYAIDRDQEGYFLYVRYWANTHIPKEKYLCPTSPSIQPLYLSRNRRNRNQHHCKKGNMKVGGDKVGVKTINYNLRRSWKANSKIECFSNTHKKWFNATVIKRVKYAKDSEDCLKIKWTVNNRSKIERLKAEIKKIKKENDGKLPPLKNNNGCESNNNGDMPRTLQDVMQNTQLHELMTKEVCCSSVQIRHRYPNMTKVKPLTIFKDDDYKCLSIDMIMVDEPIIKPSKYIKKRKGKNAMSKLKSTSDELITVAPTHSILSHISSKEVEMKEVDVKEEYVLDANLLSFFENNSTGTGSDIEDTESIDTDSDINANDAEKKEFNDEIERYKFKLKLCEQDLKAEQLISGPLLKEVEFQKIQLENIRKVNKKLKRSLSVYKLKSKDERMNEEIDDIIIISAVKSTLNTVPSSSSTKALIDAAYDQKMKNLEEQIICCKRELQEKDIKLNEFKQSSIHFEHNIQLLEKQLKEEQFIRETKATAESDIADYMPKLRSEVRKLTLSNEELIRKCADTQLLVKSADLEREKFEDLYEKVKRDTNNYQSICSRAMNSGHQMNVSIDSLQHMIVHMSSHMHQHLSNIRVCNEQICNHMQKIILSQNSRCISGGLSSENYEYPEIVQNSSNYYYPHQEPHLKQRHKMAVIRGQSIAYNEQQPLPFEDDNGHQISSFTVTNNIRSSYEMMFDDCNANENNNIERHEPQFIDNNISSDEDLNHSYMSGMSRSCSIHGIEGMNSGRSSMYGDNGSSVVSNPISEK